MSRRGPTDREMWEAAFPGEEIPVADPSDRPAETDAELWDAIRLSPSEIEDLFPRPNKDEQG